MLRMIARRRGKTDIAAGTDRVFCGLTLPSDSVINDIKIRCSIFNNGSVFSQKNEALMYGVEGYILPIHDPDNASPYNTIWDQLVPKDTDTELVDLDATGVDATPFFEPGEIDWHKVLDVGLRPQKIYGRYKLLTYMDAPFRMQDTVTPFLAEWIGGDKFGIRITRPLRVRQPSIVVFAVASPSLDDTTTTEESVLAEPKLSQVKYMEETLERAHLSLIGLTEPGAETPFEEASALIKEHLEPDVFELTSDAYVPVTWTLYYEMMIGHSVVGRFGRSTLSTGR